MSDIVERLEMTGRTIYIAVEKEVADQIKATCDAAIEEIERQRAVIEEIAVGLPSMILDDWLGLLEGDDLIRFRYTRDYVDNVKEWRDKLRKIEGALDGGSDE